MDRTLPVVLTRLLKLKKRYWKYKNSGPEGENQYIGEIKILCIFNVLQRIN